MKTSNVLAPAAALMLAGVMTCGLIDSASATIFQFNVTFNGTAATVDAGSDPIAGTNLVPGDSFILDIHAANNDFWTVSPQANLSIYDSFLVLDSGTRTGNATTTFLLDGAAVAQDVDLGQSQSFIHIGAQLFTLNTGLNFDEVRLSYDFLSTTSTHTTISSSPDVISFSPFFRDANVHYEIGAVAAVPEPSSIALLGIGLAALGFASRRRRKSA